MFISLVIWGFTWNYAYGSSGLLPILGRFDIVVVGIITGFVRMPHAYAMVSSAML
jgi:hypothetical protein